MSPSFLLITLYLDLPFVLDETMDLFLLCVYYILLELE